MMENHRHVIEGQLMMKILDYQTFTVGCETCGPQWVVTTNWSDHTLSIAWVHVPLRIFFDADRMLVIPENDCPSWREPKSLDQVDDSPGPHDHA